MALTDFAPKFENSYQEHFDKFLVAKEVASMKYRPQLKYGESVERVAFDTTSVQVRSVVRGSAATIDSVTDSSELLQVNLEYQAVFHISDGEMTQAGPLNPAEVIGAQIAHLVAQDFDARVLAQIDNANQTFDTGDLTALASNGTPITLSSTTVPQFVSRAPAKLRRANQTLTNLIMVVDSYAASDFSQYLLGKNIDLAGNTFKNGYSGDISNARVYVSENLMGEGVLAMATNPTNGDTIVYNGVTITFVATLSGGASEIHIASTVDITRANLTEWFNAGGANAESEATNTGYSAASAEDQLLLKNITATNDNTANTMTLQQIGSGALTLSETFTDGTDTWSKNFIHCYFGKQGGIDAVLQDMKKVAMRETDDRLGVNIFAYYLGGVKTFADGAKKFLDVHIAR